jgi:ABC-type uncharacterized transport system substrate-binding protein
MREAKEVEGFGLPLFLGPKQIEFLHELLPTASSVGVLVVQQATRVEFAINMKTAKSARAASLVEIELASPKVLRFSQTAKVHDPRYVTARMAQARDQASPDRT